MMVKDINNLVFLQFILEEYTLEDILDYVTREDLRRLNLK